MDPNIGEVAHGARSDQGGRDKPGSPAQSGAAGVYASAAQRSLRIRLPAAYRHFLDQIDRGTVLAPRGLILDCDRLWASREAARHLLKDSRADYSLGRFDFVFLFQQRYRFFFFRCDEADDPAVYRFSEGERAPRLIAASFSAWQQGLTSPAAARSSDHSRRAIPSL